MKVPLNDQAGTPNEKEGAPEQFKNSDCGHLSLFVLICTPSIRFEPIATTENLMMVQLDNQSGMSKAERAAVQFKNSDCSKHWCLFVPICATSTKFLPFY